MREGRPVAGRLPRSLLGRAMGLQPPRQPPAGQSAVNEGGGTPAYGTDDEHTLMLFEDGTPMLYEDSTYMTYETP